MRPMLKSDGWPGLPEFHGSVPSIRGDGLGTGVQLRLVARDGHRAVVALVLLWDDPGSTSFVLTAIGLGVVLIGVT